MMSRDLVRGWPLGFGFVLRGLTRDLAQTVRTVHFAGNHHVELGGQDIVENPGWR